jgi:hypothetical protein
MPGHKNPKASCRSDSDNNKHRRREQKHVSSSDSFTTVDECEANQRRNKCRSPRRRSQSPRHRSQSPRHRSQSPRRRSQSPRHRSQSPCRKPKSPRRKSQSPRRRSSCSSESDTAEELIEINNRSHARNKQVNHKINILDATVRDTRKKEKVLDTKIEVLDCKLNKNTKKDKEVEKKIEKLKHKIVRTNKLERAWRLKYRTVVERMRREKCLMVNGSDAYGSFYTFAPQVIQPNAPAVFQFPQNVLNILFTPGSTFITVQRSGVYTLNLTAQFDQPCQVAIFVNGVPDLTTVTASNSGAHIVTVHQLFKLMANDKVSFNNYISNVPITTSIPASGSIANSQNIDFTIIRIAPLPEKCCTVPEINSKPWCYYDSDSCSDFDLKSCEKDSSSDSDSDCEKKVKKNKKCKDSSSSSESDKKCVKKEKKPCKDSSSSSESDKKCVKKEKKPCKESSSSSSSSESEKKCEKKDKKCEKKEEKCEKKDDKPKPKPL